MPTICGSGGSSLADTRAATAQAITRAKDGLAGARPVLGFLFASPTHDLPRALAEASTRCPIDWLLASTAGEATELGTTQGGIAILLISWGEAAHRLARAVEMAEPPDETAKTLCGDYRALIDEARGRGWKAAATAILGDGMSPLFEPLIAQVRRATWLHHTVVGGGAADDAALVKSWIGSSARGRSAVIERGGVTAVHVASRCRWGIGIGQGVTPASERMTVTRASRHIVHELDGRPALAVYRERATRGGLELGPDNIGEYLLHNQLGIYFFDDIVRVRAGLGTTDDGSVVFAGEVPEGSAVAFMQGTPDALIAAAREAAEKALAEVEGKPAGALLFSCVTRGLILKERWREEIEAVRDALGADVPIAGFSSYGEVARVKGKLDGYHNNTLVVAVIPR